MKAMSVSNAFFRRFLAAATLGVMVSVAQAPVALAQSPGVVLPDFTSIVEKADPAVVNIRTTATVPVRGMGPGGGNDPYELFRWFFGPEFQPPGGGTPNPRQRPQPQPEERTVPRGVGSGFFISDDGYILTNNHVVVDATDIYVTLTDGREFKAKVIGTDERTDVALIKIEAKDMTPLVIGDPKKLKKGQWVLAIGSPFGLDSTVTSGIVSAIGRDTGEYLPFIQTDVAVNPGNSGGPLINLDGEVVGINSQIISRSGGFMGISLAIPIDEAMRVVDQLRATGKVTRGRVGVQIGEVGKDVAEAIGLPKAEQQERIKRTLDLVNLSGFEKKYPWQLSGGMQQRASIARALAFDADLLLMDEPFGALDEIVRDHLNEQLLRLWRQTNKTICFVTHSIPEAVYLSTRIVVMSPRPGRVTDVIESTLPRERPLDIRESPEFLAIAARVRDGLRAGHSYED